MNLSHTPHVVGIGGPIREASTSEAALQRVMRELAGRGFATSVFTGADLNFPLFDPSNASAPQDARLERYVDTVRTCDAFVSSSPVYHGGASGSLKNAFDHLQPLAIATDERPYLTRRAVLGLASGGGLPGAWPILSDLRDVVQALRGWSTPMQLPINASAKPFNETRRRADRKLGKTLQAGIYNLYRSSIMYCLETYGWREDRLSTVVA